MEVLGQITPYFDIFQLVTFAWITSQTLSHRCVRTRIFLLILDLHCLRLYKYKCSRLLCSPWLYLLYLLWSVSAAPAVRVFYLNTFSVLCRSSLSLYFCVHWLEMFYFSLFGFCLHNRLLSYSCVTQMKIHNIILNKTLDSHIKTTQGNNLARFSTAQKNWHSTQQAFLSLVIVALWCIVRVLHLTGLTAKSSCMIFKFSLPFGRPLSVTQLFLLIILF